MRSAGGRRAGTGEQSDLDAAHGGCGTAGGYGHTQDYDNTLALLAGRALRYRIE